ncbi:hypothetical protein AB4097_12230 [Microvirga sp. 2MCAF35]|uniref:hypothetical protein n=1 Tax=Microvirga sp. 2MCAF35 TaxID=3232987 RepID=UPI003F9E3ACF
MSSSAHPDLWSDLSGFGSPDGSPDARAALLKVNAEMFVAAAARDRESIETFETLVLGFLPKTDTATKRDLARILAPCPDTPASILDYLARHSPDAVNNPHHRPAPPFRRRQLATSEGRIAIASQPDLDSATVHKLLALRENTVEDALAANPALLPDTEPFADLLRQAGRRPALAAILLDRADLPAAAQASLYLAAPRERREAIRERIAACLAHRRVSLSFTLTEQDLTDLMAAGLKGDEHRLETILTALFGFPPSTEWRLLETGRHRLLALALNVLGVPRREAIRIFLNLHPALSYPLSAIRTLVHEMQDVPGPVALALIECILDVKILSGEALA